MSKVILKGHIMVPKSDLDIVTHSLSQHITLTRQEPGCLVFEVTQDIDDETRFHVYEEFVDKTAFSLHQNRVKYSKWGQVTKRVERHYQIYENDCN